MIALNTVALDHLPAHVQKPGYHRDQVKVGIVHFSLGNFHRAHQAVYLDRCLHRPGQEQWGILGVGLVDDDRERKKAAVFPLQDHLYTLTEYPPSGDPETRVIGAMVDYLHAPRDPEVVLTRLCDPAIRIVSMTITEGGYNIDDRTGLFKLHTPDVAQDLVQPGAPKTIFGYVVEALRRRREAGIAPFTIMSCDNLRHNGKVARAAFLGFAQARNPQLAAWISDNVMFPNSMVDRITPATLYADAVKLNEISGVDDKLPVFSEDFLQWVVEDKFVTGRPDLHEVGVQMTTDVWPYEQVKLRLLNASHLMLTFAGLLAGYRLVHEAMADPLFPELLDQFMEFDSIPLLQVPPDLDPHAYKHAVIARFKNPNIGDQLLRIASDGAAKLTVFIQDTAKAVVEQQRDPKRIAFLLACFVRYLNGKDDLGKSIAVIEPNLTPADRDLASMPGASALGMSVFAGWGLESYPDFVSQFTRHLNRMGECGVNPVLSELLGYPDRFQEEQQHNSAK